MKITVRLIKAVGYRILSIIVQLLFVYYVTHSINLTILIVPLNIILILIYMAYDKLWERLLRNIKWTIKSPAKGILPSKVRAAMDLVRPATLLPAAVVGFVGALIVHLGILYSIGFGFLLVFMQAGGQSLNQSNKKEIELDVINGKTYRPTVDGRLSISEAKLVAYLCLAGGIAVGFVLHVVLLAAIMASTAILYTQEPFYLKRFFPINLMVQALGRGFLPVFTLGYVTGRDTLPLAIFLFVWVFALQSTKDFHDYEGDKKFGIMTLPVLMGKRNAKITMFLITIFDYVFALATGMWYLLAIAPLDITSILTCEKEIKIAENSLGWSLYYASLGIGTVLGLAL